MIRSGLLSLLAARQPRDSRSVLRRLLSLAPQPDLRQLQESMGKIHGLARAAVDSCLDVVTWLAPVAGAAVPLDAGVQECTGLLRSSFSFRGFPLAEALGVQGERRSIRFNIGVDLQR